MDSEVSNIEGDIKILIAVGVRLYREGLEKLLNEESGFLVLDTAVNQSSTLAKTKSLQPDVVLLDTELPDNLATIRKLRESSPGSRVLVLGVKETEAEIVSYATAGISGYVTRDGTFENLVISIRSAASGELHCSSRVAGFLLRQMARATSGARAHLGRLTPREWQVIELVDKGLSNKEIAKRLMISLHTAKNHLHNILEKAGVRSRGEAAACMRHLLIGRSA